MNKWILSLLLVAAGAFGFWKYDPFQLFGKTDEVNSLLRYIPADTVFYLGGQSDQVLLDFMSDYPLGSSPSQSALFEGLRKELAGKNSAFDKLATYLLNDYANSADKTYGGLLRYLGMGAGGEFAIYMHGIVPVMNLPLVEVEKFRSLVEKASTEAGLKYQTRSVGAAELKTWKFGEEGAQQVELVIATTANSAIITFIGKEDSEQVILERLAQLVLKDSLASSGDVEQIKDKYAYTDDAVIIINFQNLAAGILSSEESGFGRDLTRYLPREASEKLVSHVSDACKKDYLSLIANMPRMVGGYTSIDINNNTLESDFRVLFEVKNPVVTTALQQIQGHIPVHVLKSDDKLLGFGVAFDIDELTPAVTALWTAFISADYSCEQLKEAQNKARQQSPAMMGMVTGMAQGIKGAGLSLYDFSWGATLDQPKNVSAVLSVAASNPKSLLSLVQMVPMLNGFSLPLDGTASKLDLPMLLADLDLFGAVKGQHIVIYSGSMGEQAAETLSGEQIEANGLYAASINYRKLLAMGETFDLTSAPIAQNAICTQYYEFMNMMDSMRMDFSFLLNALEEGIQFRTQSSVDKPKTKSALDITGPWKVERLDESCQWLTRGKDELNQDGTGRYTELDGGGQCETHLMVYHWERQGDKIIFNGTESEKSRGTCEQQWEESNATRYECYIMNAEGNSFQCIFDPETEEASLFRYSKM